MKLAVRHFVLGFLVLMCSAGSASAQYMKITTDNPGDATRLRAAGTTILTITIDTNHDRDTSLQTCNSHTAANACGAVLVGMPLDMFGYTLAFKAVGGTVTWGTFTASDPAYTDVGAPISNSTEIEINQFRPTGTVTPPGLATIGTLPVTIATGSPRIDVQIGAGALNPFGFGTGFATNCDGFANPNFYVVGDPADPCGLVSGTTGDWFDWDGAGAPAGSNSQPIITAPATASGAEGSPIVTITAAATDADAANTLTIAQVGMPASLVFTSTPGPSPRSATITGTPGFNDAGTYNIVWTVSDGTGSGNSTASTTTVLTITNTNQAPTLNQPANMTVNEAATADQVITGTDPDGNLLTFSKVSGPTWMTVTTLTITTGNIHLAPGSEDAGTYSATVRATDNGSPNLTDDKTFTITVNNVDRPPTLSPISNMTLAAGTTADQGISASDPDGDAITFTFTGPAWMSVTSDTQVGNARTGNIHVAPPPGTAATNYGASVTATANGQASTRNFAITVTAGANQAPVLAQPADMTVNEGATADQILNATDPDGNPLSFSLASGPSFASVTTTSAGTGTATGNIHLAPGSSDAGTYAATVRASDGSLTSDRTLTITVNDVTANQAPTLTQPTDMTVDEGDTANQTLNATDPDGNPITFSLVSGPTFATVTTTTPGTGTATGNIRLQPGYLDAGTYSATVRASDNGTPALTDDKTFTITVNNTNRPPVLSQPDNMTVAENATADQIITGFDFDPEPLTFSKVSGPTFMTVTTTAPDSGNIHLAPGYLDAGTYAATVRVTDSGGLFHDRSFTITVTNVNRPPVLNSPVANMTVNEGATADQLIDASDPDGDVLTYLKTSGPSYMTVDATTGNIHLAPGFSDAGTAGAVIEVRDTSNASANTGFMITVNNVDRPVALAEIADMVVAAGSTADQVVTATDADGDAITLTAEGPVWMTFTEDPQSDNTRTGNIHLAPPLGTTGTFAASVTATANGTETTRSFTITVNATNQAPVMEPPIDMTVDEGATADQALIAEDPDGNPLTFTKVSGPSFMTVQTLSPTLGNIHLAPGFDDAGTYAATVRATDGSLNSDQSFTITVNNVDRAPVLAIVEDMTVTAGATADQGISATDADGDAITFSFTGPAFMTVDSNAQVENTRTGNIHLAPPLGTSGTFAASVTATANGASDTENFTITVNPPAAENNPPVLTQPTNMTVNENATADQVLNATDPDGDPITFSLVTGPSFVTVTTTSAGTGTATGNVHLAPGFDDAGTYSVTVRASDNGTPALTNDKTFTITVNNVDRPPVLNAISNMTVAAGATADQGISATDPDGDAITFTFTGPAWMTVESDTQVGNTRTGNIHLAPPLGTLGTFGASVRATANGVFDTENFAIFVTPGANQAPVLAQPTNMTVNEGATLDQTLNATDPDGNPLSFTKVSGPTFMTVTTTTAGSGTATGNVHLAPGFGDSGTYAATVQASDGSLNDQKSFTITVNNIDRPPVLNAIANMTVAAGATADQGISATDPDGDAITFTFSGPAFMTVTSDTQVGNTRTGNIHLAPPAGTSGTFAASVTATANGASDTESFTITVTPSSTCQVEADASLSRDDRVIRLRSNNPSWCVTLQPASPGWQVSDIIASSIVASFGGVEIHPNSIKKVSASECGDRNDKKGKNKRKGLQVCFSKSTLRTLFASLPNGRRSVDVTITGDLAGGCEFHASVEVIVVKGNGGFAGHDDEDDDAQYGDGRFSHASPNPFNPSTTIHFELSRPGSVRLHIYDVAGRLVKTLADEFMASGAHHVTWDGTSRSGSRVASGVYFYVLETPERTVKSQLVVAK